MKLICRQCAEDRVPFVGTIFIEQCDICCAPWTEVIEVHADPGEEVDASLLELP